VVNDTALEQILSGKIGPGDNQLTAAIRSLGIQRKPGRRFKLPAVKIPFCAVVFTDAQGV